jgi:hypothetical protein
MRRAAFMVVVLACAGGIGVSTASAGDGLYCTPTAGVPFQSGSTVAGPGSASCNTQMQQINGSICLQAYEPPFGWVQVGSCTTGTQYNSSGFSDYAQYTCPGESLEYRTEVFVSWQDPFNETGSATADSAPQTIYC